MLKLQALNRALKMTVHLKLINCNHLVITIMSDWNLFTLAMIYELILSRAVIRKFKFVYETASIFLLLSKTIKSSIWKSEIAR